MNIQDKFFEIKDKLAAAGVDATEYETKYILSQVLGIALSEIWLHRKQNLSGDNIRQIDDIVAQRCQHKPLGLIFGVVDFMDCTLKTRQGVFSPRPETELIVENAIDYLQRIKRVKTILELGIGSGAISCALATEFDDITIFATEISECAIQLARHNINHYQHTDRIKLIRCDKFEPLISKKLNRKVDLIVSNPPYISRKMIENLGKEVKDYDPRVSLDGGPAGLDMIKYIIDLAPTLLRPEGLLILEIGYDQGDQVTQLAQKKKFFPSFKILKDYADEDRVFIGSVTS